jgi:hypothetical protein
MTFSYEFVGALPCILSKITLQNFPDPDFGQPAEDGRPSDRWPMRK